MFDLIKVILGTYPIVTTLTLGFTTCFCVEQVFRTLREILKPPTPSKEDDE